MTKRPEDVLFFAIKERVESASQYNPKVVARADSDVFPKVVVQTEMEGPKFHSTCNRDIIQGYTVKIEIYAKDTHAASSVEIVEEIKDCIYQLLTKELGLRISFSRPTPNVDNSIYRETMRYNYELKM